MDVNLLPGTFTRVGQKCYSPPMAGHSHAKNIMHRKGAQDAKRARIYAKLIREITVAAKEGLPDPNFNPRLRAGIAAALKQNMTRDAIDRAIKKATGAGAQENYEAVRYEGYGPAGVAVIVEALTDNRNRTASDVRHAFTKFGGNLGTTGTVAWQFERRGLVVVAAQGVDEDELFLAAAEGGADDLSQDGDVFQVTSVPEALAAVRGAIGEAGFTVESAELSLIPKTTVAVADEAKAKQLMRLIDELEDNDDVQEVYANFDIPEQVLEAVAG